MQFYNFLILLLTFINCQEDQLSQNVQSSSTILDGQIIDLQWCGNDPSETIKHEGQTGIKHEPRRIFALTIEGSVYFSENEGQTWMAVRKRFKEIQSAAKNELGDDGFISKIITSTLDPNLMIFLGINGTSIYTQNCGKNFLYIKHTKSLVDMKLSKTQTSWIIGIAKYVCRVNSSYPCPTSHALYYSLDFGISWTIIANRVIQYEWGNDGTMQGAAIVPEKRIIITIQNQENSENQIKYSDDFFANSVTLAELALKFEIMSPFLFVQKEKIKDYEDNEETEYEMEVSPTYYNPYIFKKVQIPLENLKDKGFTILDSQKTIFINVDHYGPKVNFGNIYMSDLSGSWYALSQRYNVRDYEGTCDFYMAEGFEGVYLGNFYEQKAAENHLQFIEQSDQSKTKTYYENIENYKKTMITFNGGERWERLTPPKIDSLGRTINCPNCSLHLRGATESDLSTLYSRQNAIGIIIGVGNVGKYLSAGMSTLNTYFTRDGGNTWEEIAKGSHIYEIGDNGGLIIMAKDTKATNKVIYSWDEGLTWEEYQFSDEPIWVRNIVIESQNMAQVFFIYGLTYNLKHGTVISLDFNSLHQRICTGKQDPEAATSDYEYWMPHWHSSTCIFGHRIKYLRRKRESRCFNPDIITDHDILELCECSDVDYECDFGFAADTITGDCLPMNDNFAKQLDDSIAAVNCQDKFWKVTGYRKIPGDDCQGGIQKEAHWEPCPGTPEYIEFQKIKKKQQEEQPRQPVPEKIITIEEKPQTQQQKNYNNQDDSTKEPKKIQIIEEPKKIQIKEEPQQQQQQQAQQPKQPIQTPQQPVKTPSEPQQFTTPQETKQIQTPQQPKQAQTPQQPKEVSTLSEFKPQEQKYNSQQSQQSTKTPTEYQPKQEVPKQEIKNVQQASQIQTNNNEEKPIGKFTPTFVEVNTDSLSIPNEQEVKTFAFQPKQQQKQDKSNKSQKRNIQNSKGDIQSEISSAGIVENYDDDNTENSQSGWNWKLYVILIIIFAIILNYKNEIKGLIMKNQPKDADVKRDYDIIGQKGLLQKEMKSKKMMEV